jgi:hypothetical protein
MRGSHIERSGHRVRNDGVVRKSSQEDQLSAALDEVERQLRSMSRGEVLGDEELEWFVGAVVVVAEVRHSGPLEIELEASHGFLRRTLLRRVVTLAAD